MAGEYSARKLFGLSPICRIFRWFSKKMVVCPAACRIAKVGFLFINCTPIL